VRIGPQNKSNPAGCQLIRKIGNALHHETVVPEVRTRIERYGREENYYWLLQFVGDMNGYIQSRIVLGTLGTLHPVDDAVLSRIGCPWLAHRDALTPTQPFDRIHDCVNRELREREDTEWPLPVA
jgi:hypothetical protein